MSVNHVVQVSLKNMEYLPLFSRCPTRGCGCSVVKCIDVENAILNAMREWLTNYRIEIASGNPASAEQIDVTLDAVVGQLTQLQAQHILDNYDVLSPAQKNVLWKLVLKKVSVFRSEPKKPFQVKIYPNLPQQV